MLTSIIFLSIACTLVVSVYLRSKTKKEISCLHTKIQKYNINKKLKDVEFQSITSLLKDNEVERKQIMNDLHESLGSKLVAIKFQISALEANDHDPSDAYKRANSLLDEAVHETRRLAYSMSDEMHKSFNMISALNQIKRSIEEEKNIKLGIYFHGLVQNVSSELNLQLYQVIQELITNTLAHADANQINIQLYRREEEFIIMVEDDGVGFDPKNLKNKQPGLGLKSIESKLGMFDGKLFIDSTPGHGTTVTIEIPLVA